MYSNQVAPAELEGHILDHELVQDVCVIGIYDERAGEKPKAYVALVPAAKERLAKDPKLEREFEEAIKKHVADHKIHYKRLAAVTFIEAVPKTASGKLLRKDCELPPSPCADLFAELSALTPSTRFTVRTLHAASEKAKNKL